MMIPSWFVALILGFALSAFFNAIVQSCTVHQCPWPL
jgi:hypothetical protein